MTVRRTYTTLGSNDGTGYSEMKLDKAIPAIEASQSGRGQNERRQEVVDREKLARMVEITLQNVTYNEGQNEKGG